MEKEERYLTIILGRSQNRQQRHWKWLNNLTSGMTGDTWSVVAIVHLMNVQLNFKLFGFLLFSLVDLVNRGNDTKNVQPVLVLENPQNKPDSGFLLPNCIRFDPLGFTMPGHKNMVKHFITWIDWFFQNTNLLFLLSLLSSVCPEILCTRQCKFFSKRLREFHLLAYSGHQRGFTQTLRACTSE